MMASTSSHIVSQSKSGSSVSAAEALLSPRQRKGSLAQQPADINPDDLFIKHTVAEVKAIQRNLRNDADAKQEELRQMVGERYRDLLQASTSIISIAQSSKHVISALEETRAAIAAQEKPSLHSKPTSTRGPDDPHLSALQSLSAHIKLLLDVPEHLWRLMEKKKYLTAAWLYLLSRVVHRALIRDDEREEETWNSQGIDVLDQFPLVQRQWEHVSSFRQQIIVRAKQSFQEYAASVEDTCATLLTLHLLESQPLTEALSLLLDKRSKALEAVLSASTSPNHPPSPTLSRRRGRSLSLVDKTVGGGRTLREVKESIVIALDCICRTVKTVRDILEDRGKEQSLIRQVLGHIQNDHAAVSIPSDLKLSTQDLLMSLPSSAHFLLLPQNLRSYKPYVDLDSSSTRVKADVLEGKVEIWFEKAIKALRSAVHKWLLEIQSVKNVWAIRIHARTWLQSSSDIDNQRITQLGSILDDVCRQRIINLWSETLETAGKDFEDRLSSVLSSFGDKKTALDASPIRLMFQAPALPTTSVGGGTLETSFQKYRATLSKQLLGRTPLLDDMLGDIEASAQTIHHDLHHVLGKDDIASSAIIQELLDTYRPMSEGLCTKLSDILHSNSKQLVISSQSDLDAVVFVGHLVDELATSSTFITDVSCDEDVASGFRSRCTQIHETTIERWREFTVSTNVTRYKSSLRLAFEDKTCVSPSPNLSECLLSLANSITNLRVSRDIDRRAHLVERTIHLFVSHLLAEDVRFEGLQGLHDLILLKKLAELFDPQSTWSDIHTLVQKRIAGIKGEISPDVAIPSDIETTARVSEYLARTQILFAAILSCSPVLPGLPGVSSSAFLPLGTPSLNRDVPAALDLAESPSRFGLLLVN